MHPAPSVIVFTTLSGLGFGLLFFLGLGAPAVTGWTAFAFFFLAYGLAVGGLLASVTHLANPKNAIKAFSQWQSSWLSREGIFAVGALVVMGLYAIGAVFLGQTWSLFGFIGAFLALGTVFTTSMIYTQLRAVPRWNQLGTPVHFLSLSLGGGALLAGQIKVAMGLLLIAAIVQVWHWWKGDRRFAEVGSTMNTATGLSGQVRQLEPPHTGQNYLLKEMVYVVARRHGTKLRVIAFVLAFLVPFGLLMLPMGHLGAALAALSHLAGVAASRWLFFAEAEHVVGLYYGAR